MTENEALKIAIHCLGVQAEQEVCEECPVYRESGIVCKVIARTAISALEEVQRYHEIGTVEELTDFKNMKNRLETYHANINVSKLFEYFIETVFENTKHEGFIILTNKEAEDYEAYCSIGTVEQCREAVEKQKAKMVINGKLIKNFYGRPYYIKGDCPTCGRESIKSTDTDYCYVCGQHLKWDENLREMESEEE